MRVRVKTALRTLRVRTRTSERTKTLSRAEAKEGSGFNKHTAIRGESEKARRHSQKLADELGNEMVSIDMDEREGVSFLRSRFRRSSSAMFLDLTCRP